MATWAEYIDRLMDQLPSGKLSSAAVVGQDGGVWAASPSFPGVTTEQVATLMQAFHEYESTLKMSYLGEHGIVIGSDANNTVKYQLAPGDETVIRGKGKGSGVCIKRTGQALIFGIYDDPVTAGDCNVVVEGTGDYLAQNGY